MIVFRVVLAVVGAVCVGGNVLAVADFAGFQTSGNYFGYNFAGISLNFSQIYTSAMNTSLFQAMLANSKAFGSSNSMWSDSIKVQWPKGYKYNCAAYTAMGIPATCVYSYSGIGAKLTPFVKAVGNYITGQVGIGFDMENANFSNANFTTYFSSYVTAMIAAIGASFYTITIEAFDGADQFATNGIIPNYNAASFVSDINAAVNLGSGYSVWGPGVSQSADDSWLATYNTLRGKSRISFTVKAVTFNASTPTIADLLSEINYRNFLQRRFTYSGEVLNPLGGNLIISEMKMTSGVGVDGVTNVFASPLWAIDTALEFAMFGGKGIRFPCDISAGNLQTIIGPSPGYAATPLYYGLLFLSSISYVNPQVGMPQVSAGSSSSIKVYGLQIPGQLMVVLLNKDTNTSASGVVQLHLNSSDSIRCLYLTGPSLTATTGITWMGYTFNSGSSVPQGNYTVFTYNRSNLNSTYKTNSTNATSFTYGTYYIPLNYSQAAMCYLGSPGTNFPYSDKHEANLAAIFLLALIALFIV